MFINLSPARHQNTFATRHHHHPAQVGLASVARIEMKSHVNEHYCLASVKAAKMFAEIFADEAIIVSQDDKAKVGLGTPAVGRTFKTIQTINEPVTVEDHDFPVGSKMKLIPSVYLIIDLTDSNNQVRPIWVLLVDGGPDKNPKHMKNIIQYAHLFRDLNLDYLTICTHAPGQSAYNPVERSMASLSGKLAVDEELARQNFEFSGKKLCDIWKRDDIYGKPVTVEYVDQEISPFDESDSSISWKWIENHTQICRYSLDIKKCKNRECCSEYRALNAAILLNENDGFLSPVTKGKDGHFINPIHVLQYYDRLKILLYDRSCPSISQELHQQLCCNICGKYFPTLKFISEHKRNMHSRHHPQNYKPLKKNYKRINEIELECVTIPLIQKFQYCRRHNYSKTKKLQEIFAKYILMKSSRILTSLSCL
ncbi:unnamed protein product [Rhizophagus irregularis]|nr:unnamed protein product [Rhizophagus irregularis]